MRKQRQSALIFVLRGLMPYSRENMMLSYKPNVFFNELERKTKYNNKTLRNAYYRGRQRGMITGGQSAPRLTSKGESVATPLKLSKLTQGRSLMVIFDFPEENRSLRNKFRGQLKEWQFEQIQKSVWLTNMDFREQVIDIIAELGAGQYVQIYESEKTYP